MIVLKSIDLLYMIKQSIQVLKCDANLYIVFNTYDKVNNFNVLN